MFLIDDILLAPVTGVLWMGEKIREMVEKEMLNEGRLKEKLMELQLLFELGELCEEEYEKKENDILVQLVAVRKAKEGRCNYG